VLAVGALAAIGVTAGRPDPSSSRPPGAIGLVAYRSCAELLSGLREHTAANIASLGYRNAYVGAGQAEAVPLAAGSAAAGSAAAAAPAAPEHSTTTVHEAGADEPDVVKTDGRRVVTVAHGMLRVVDVATRRITGTIRVAAAGPGWAPAGNLLISGDRALVILPDTYGDGVASARPYPPLPQASTRFVLVDVAGAPKVLGTQTVTGSYVDARLVGSVARLVARSQPVIKYPPPRFSQAPQQLPGAGREAVRTAPVSAWLPAYRISDSGGTVTRSVECGQVSHPAVYTGTSLLTVYSVDLSRQLGSIPPISVAADGDTVYATEGSLYVASNPRWSNGVPGAVPPGTPVPTVGAEQTDIHRFDITGPGAPRYVASGAVPGQLLNQYSLSEYAGDLRVATTSGDAPTGQQSAVYELDASTLARLGSVRGLGRGQRIYAVRFLGPVGYVVTFRQVDPLYTLDLRNPAKPRVAGELELTGYSAYLSPASEGRLIGVGQEANSQGRTTGLQVALFDVRDPGHPTRLAQVVRDDVHSAAEWDPHAFLYWPATGTVVLPMTARDGSQPAASALVLRVTASALTVQGTISHPEGRPGPGLSRAMVIGADLWTLSDAGLQVNDVATLATRDWVAL
jgi:uncharacterized secreted protein with C-terminal beta-propeller domain